MCKIIFLLPYFSVLYKKRKVSYHSRTLTLTTMTTKSQIYFRFIRRKATSRIKRAWQTFFYSMPIRLLAIQLAQYPFLVGLWLLIMGVLTGSVAKSFGAQYALLEPEYMGKVGFWSFLIMGICFGFFVFGYMITIYISTSYRFPFLVMRKSPFLTFSLNNFLLPGIFMGMYMLYFTRFQAFAHGGFTYYVFARICGLLVGMFAIFFLLATTFFATNKNIFQYFGAKLQLELEKRKPFQNTLFANFHSKKLENEFYRVDYYIGIYPPRLAKVDDTKYIPKKNIFQVMNQNHGNLLLLQILFICIILALGYWDDIQYFQLPLGATVLVGLTGITMIAGAITFWLRKLGFWTLILVGLILFAYQKVDFLSENNWAFGMNYQKPYVSYTKEKIKNLIETADIQKDSIETIQLLENWKKRWQEKYGNEKKPNAIFLCSSGGGLRAGMWSLGTMQYLDSLTNGRSTDELRLMTGASGGMMGAAFFRELMLKPDIKTYKPEFQQRFSNDMLQSAFYRIIIDACFLNFPTYIGKKRYDYERGYVFDKHFCKNLPEFEGRRLGDYRELEFSGKIPQMILAPAILNQANMLYISPMGVSYLTQNHPISNNYTSHISGVEFRRLFEGNEPDSLRFATALRMNATFPYIFPAVSLPSKPEMRLMDAGLLDNLGATTAARYLRFFKDWFAQNTENVIFIIARDTEKEADISEVPDKIVGNVISPLGQSVHLIMSRDESMNNYYLESVKDWYKGKFQVVSIEYPLEKAQNPASLSFHLTEVEKQYLVKYLHNQENTKRFEMVRQIYEKE